MPKNLSGSLPTVPRTTEEIGQTQVLQRLLDLYEQYRKTVAYEIHDGIVQYLTGSQMHLETALQALGDRVPPAAQEAFERVQQCLRDGIAEARNLMSSLRPAPLDEFGLITAIDHLVEQCRKRTAATIEWCHVEHFARLAPPLQSALFRMVQEGLGNALRHSGSNKVRITLGDDGECVFLTIEDWGRGFDPGKVAKSRHGLQGIGERARILGGHAIIDSAPGSGTHITVELPLLAIPGPLVACASHAEIEAP